MTEWCCWCRANKIGDLNGAALGQFLLHKIHKRQHRSLVLKKTVSLFSLAVSQRGSALSAIAQLCSVSLMGATERILVSPVVSPSLRQFPHLLYS